MSRRLLIFILIVIVAAAAAVALLSRRDNVKLAFDAVVGQRPTISPPRNELIPTVNIAKPIGWQGNARPVAAAGLTVSEYAGDLDHPRWMTLLPNGDVLVAETNSPPRKGGGVTGFVMNLLLGRAGAAVPSANRITLLRDADGDGRPEARSVLLTGLNSPFGMALVGDRLFIGNTDAIVAYPFKVGQTKITAKPQKIASLPGGGNHWSRNLIPAPDGKSLFVAVGSASNIGEKGLELETHRANILQVDIASGRYNIFASGLRNPVGLAYEPKTGALWTVVNERDMMGGDLSPDYLTRVEFAAFYGWPHTYWGGYLDRRVQPERPDLQEYAKRPDYALGAHVAALGLAFATDAKLGSRFANGAFVGEHGSWNRKPPSGYKVVYVPFGDNGYPVKGVKPVDLLTGFLDAKGRAQGRPVGVIVDKTGALLVADDVGDRIWRVSAAEAQAPAK
ncbi:PQQ-dependent sugar dehydrogenase [Sphingomonas flavalba]|uniref:PQQ-dependent sugar dehydrogenase n=1 Tax=Sphingomonas flavalba TaxID=2559804 RepID=UPI00109E17A5|nr:sorbosone dehydrogenase family protein [Sphingomonas flavalba]